MEDLANLFADEALAEKRFSRPGGREAGGDDVAVGEGGQQSILRSEGRSKGAVARDDVAVPKVGEGSGLRSRLTEEIARDDVWASLRAETGGEGGLGGDDVGRIAGMTSEAGVSSGMVEEGRKIAEREGVLSAEAAAVLTPPLSSSDGRKMRKAEAATGTVWKEKPPEPNPGSASGRDLDNAKTESERRTVSGSKSAGQDLGPAKPGESIGRLQGSIPEGASTVFLDEGRFLKLEDASIEEKAASLGLFQEVGPDSKVSTFEAPTAKREFESVREKQGKKQEWAVSEGFRNSQLKGSEDSKQSGGWLGQKVAKLGSDGGLGLEDAVKAAVGEHLGAEKRVKRGAKKDRGLSRAFEEGFKALKGGPGSGVLEEPSGKGKRGGKRRGVQDKEVVKGSGESLQGESGSSKTRATGENEEGRDSGAADGGSKPNRKVSNPFLTQTMAASASRVASSEDPETPSRPLSPELPPSTELSQNVPNFDKPSGAGPRQEPSNPGVPSSAKLSQNSPNPGKPSSAGSTQNPLNPKETLSSGNPPNPEPAFEPAASSGSPQKKKDYPEWMPSFMDKIHPDSPNFDPEAYANTHPIKRAMMDDDPEGRFPDFSLEALQGPAPETSRPLEEGDPEPEFSPETHPDNVIDEALNVTEEQRAKVLEAANAVEFDPAAYDKTAPPWEAFRGFGMASRDLEGYDVEGTRDLREQDQEFDVPVKGGGTKRVKIPAGGFKSEEELNAAFKGESSILEHRVGLHWQLCTTPAAST
jgi:hypothetical protein